MNKCDATLDAIDKLEKKLRNIGLLDKMMDVKFSSRLDCEVEISDVLHSLYHRVKKHCNKG